jgi:hypothetical protein
MTDFLFRMTPQGYVLGVMVILPSPIVMYTLQAAVTFTLSVS